MSPELQAQLLEWLDHPLAPAAGGALLALLAVAGVAALVLRYRRVSRRLEAALADPTLAEASIRERFGQTALLRRSRLLETLAERYGPRVVEVTGIDRFWIEQLETRRGRKELLRVLRHAPERGLLPAFHTVLANPGLSAEFIDWLDRSGDLLQVRRVALANGDRPFAGAGARELFRDRLDQVREMAGDPEWTVRLFAVRILLHDDEERSRQALWDAFTDSHPRVRHLPVTGFFPDDRQRCHDILMDLVLRDPAFEVRRAAWERIHAHYPDLYALDPEGLAPEETLHLLELLRPDDAGDVNFAMGHLASDDRQLRLLAARLLERGGALLRLALGVDFGDREGLERNLELLHKALEVNVAGFLAPAVEQAQSPGALYLCARLLREREDEPALVAALCRKVFAQPVGGGAWTDLYRATLDTAALRGDPETLRLLDRELEQRRGEPKAMMMLLDALPPRGAPFFLERLMALFREPEGPNRDDVREALKRMPPDRVLPWLLDAVRSPMEALPMAARIDAVRLLVEMELPYCLETVLENLWLLPPRDARAVMEVLPRYPKDLLTAKLNRLLGAPDSRMRAAIISALPATGNQSYLPRVRAALGDVEPDVRIAAIWALTEFEQFDWGKDGIEILRDPAERVRVDAARALGRVGGREVLGALQQRLDDADESLSVKEAALRALGRTESVTAVDMLVGRLEHPELREPALRALAGKVNSRELGRVFERFKDADATLRQRLTEVFARMGERGALAMTRLLQEDIASLRPYILEVLEATGHLEHQIRRLSHRDAPVRREAAGFLTNVGSLPALRGLVLAAKDPDEQVRISVVRALERLAGEQSRELLEQLQNDPARKVRRYTHWALERVKAKAL